MTVSGVKPFRFGVNLLLPDSRDAWVAKCRRVEEAGFDVLSVADHLGLAPPFPALVLAGEVTSRVRLNTFVLNVGFHKPALLAREVTGTDQFVGGRLELGLGAGYVAEEFEAAELEFPSPGRRVDHLEHTIKELKRRYADPEHRPAPVEPGGPPLLIGGNGNRMLALAVEHADIIAFPGSTGLAAPHLFVPMTADEIEDRVRFVNTKLGDRAGEPEFNLLVHFVDATEDRQAALEELHGRLPDGPSVAELAGSPTVLFGSPEEIAQQLLAHRERFGFSYYTVLEHHLEAFAPVVELLRGR
ncbi:TIGR03621 family F420-dependent LLM class oxidoreductase [Amycolatopsis sp. PS_44_ISF1]|uniref:TIGR03621 family F420-dependent LLM class oxidoreductase n=1 Tax=Amycolatopsis sp. PS_44_ISF1 TaxID=2974917 RepID=UPI0028DDD9C5|nr:TIGR03621 family F420-dependent LLM class oxidoreductase [Amycolatopsis sp. PS_44_ISF1]MDT8910533.1 TIGR03621 family F420-dependent LLM class oxidoreductase [Amycolatopsis sp. PS_44_ISF1]